MAGRTTVVCVRSEQAESRRDLMLGGGLHCLCFAFVLLEEKKAEVVTSQFASGHTRFKLFQRSLLLQRASFTRELQLTYTPTPTPTFHPVLVKLPQHLDLFSNFTMFTVSCDHYRFTMMSKTHALGNSSTDAHLLECVHVSDRSCPDLVRSDGHHRTSRSRWPQLHIVASVG